jgi:hypothetical protein
MLNDITQEVGCDGCSVSTAEGEMDAIASAWLVDAHAVPRRHICPVCLAGAGEVRAERSGVERDGARIGSARRRAGKLGLAPG